MILNKLLQLVNIVSLLINNNVKMYAHIFY